MPTKKQLALIHVAKAALGLADDVYRDILHVQAGVESSKDLSARGVEAVLRQFRALGWRRRQGAPRKPRLPGELPTPLQLAKVKHLFEDVGWHEAGRRQGFTKRVCNGHPWPQDREEANKLIEALKAMVRRGYQERRPRNGAPLKPPASSA